MWWWIVLGSLLRILLTKRAYQATVNSNSLKERRAVVTLINGRRLRLDADPGLAISRYADDIGHRGSMVNQLVKRDRQGCREL